jgi:hypothetical protein
MALKAYNTSRAEDLMAGNDGGGEGSGAGAGAGGDVVDDALSALASAASSVVSFVRSTAVDLAARGQGEGPIGGLPGVLLRALAGETGPATAADARAGVVVVGRAGEDVVSVRAPRDIVARARAVPLTRERVEELRAIALSIADGPEGVGGLEWVPPAASSRAGTGAGAGGAGGGTDGDPEADASEEADALAAAGLL